MALFLNVLITPLAETKIMDNQNFIDKANAENSGKLPDDPSLSRVPVFEEHTKVTYIESKEENIGGVMHTMQVRQDIKYFGKKRPKLGSPQVFLAKLVEYTPDGGRAALSYKLMELIDPKDLGLNK